jgi:hypothetical protein
VVVMMTVKMVCGRRDGDESYNNGGCNIKIMEV